MAPEYNNIAELLRQRADLNARLALMPYDGTPEIKSRDDMQYLYVRKRVAGKLTSTYVGAYTPELYNQLLRNAREARELRKQLRAVDKQLAAAGYAGDALPATVTINVAFARANMKQNIYEQAVLEGVTTTFPQTEDVIEGGQVYGLTATDVQKILNLKHAWEFILDPDVVASRTDFYLLSHIARLVNEGFFAEGGRVRGVPVSIGGSSYVPPLPVEVDVQERIRDIVADESSAFWEDGEGGEADTEVDANANSGSDKTDDHSPIDTAIKLCLYCMKTQIFLDGNERAAVILANHYLIAHGGGLLVIPEAAVPEFKRLLVEYYEGANPARITAFMKDRCWRRLEA